ncbi:MAG: hypothetical protein Q4G35_00255 [Propionibacteriaceae bacterium]|nr:hypothetical protein [Propionibacteriaceae bacterium]
MARTASRAEHPPGYHHGRLHTFAGQPLTLHTEFDVEAYTRGSRGRIRVDKAAVELPGGELREDLAFLWRLDSAHLSDTRALLATWTGNEGRITAFVATWAYERLWLAHAVRDLLTADGGPLPEPLGRTTLIAKVRNLYVERGLPIVAPIWTSIAGESVTAGHMARLAIQEGAFQAAYLALLPRLDGEARRVVEEIARRRDEMIRFFRLEAAARISRSPQEARMAKLHLLPSWRPLRIIGAADPDEPRALRSIFRSPADRARLAAADTDLRRLLAERPTSVFWGAQAPTPGLLSRKARHGIRS